MRDLLACEGIPPEMLIVEDVSKSTRENAVFIARLLASDTGSKVLLTSDYHIYPASRVFRKAGVAIFPRPIPDEGKRGQSLSGRLSAFLDEMTESSATYSLRGWV